MKTSDTVAITGFLLLLGMLALWCIDISVSAIINGGVVYNGIFFGDPFLTYHLGLYLLVFVIFILFLFIVHILVKDNEPQTPSNQETQQ